MCVGAVRLSPGFLCVMTIAQITRERKNHACLCHQRRNAHAEVGLTPYNFREQTIVKMDRTGVKTITVPIGGKKTGLQSTCIYDSLDTDDLVFGLLILTFHWLQMSFLLL